MFIYINIKIPKFYSQNKDPLLYQDTVREIQTFFNNQLSFIEEN